MENANTEVKKQAPKKSTKKTTKSTVKETIVDPVESPVEESKQRIIPKDIDLNQTVIVRSGYQGRLFYRSSRTGERFVWPEFGEEQEMELRELKNAKSVHKKFFINNWFMFDEDWIPEFLGVSKMYENAIPIEHFDELFNRPADEIAAAISEMSDGQKKSVSYRARQLIADGAIDSIKAINVLEKSLGIELIER